MLNPLWYLVLTLYMSSQSWYSCGFFCLLWLVDVPVLSNLVVGEADPRTPMAIGRPSPFRFGEGGGRAKSGSRRYTRAVLPSFGPHGCIKPYCCLFVCIEF